MHKSKQNTLEFPHRNKKPSICYNGQLKSSIQHSTSILSPKMMYCAQTCFKNGKLYLNLFSKLCWSTIFPNFACSLQQSVSFNLKGAEKRLLCYSASNVTRQRTSLIGATEGSGAVTSLCCDVTLRPSTVAMTTLF